MNSITRFGPFLAAFSITAGAAAPLPAVKPARPNFLVILADDISPEHFSTYGATTVRTPAIDALAREGVRFNQAWATPMCAPSRALLLTGRYAHRTGVYHNSLQVDRHFSGSSLSFARVLRDAGYATAIAGTSKELGADYRQTPLTGFNEYCVHNGAGNLSAGGKWTGAWEIAPGQDMRVRPNGFTSRYWHPCLVQDGRDRPTTPDEFGEDIFAAYLVDFMKRHRGEPFCAYFAMNLPHGTASSGGQLPTTPAQGRPGRNSGGTMDDCTAYIDTLVGRLVAALDELGLRENTVIVFAGDNADAGNGKTCATEHGAHAPLVIAGPPALVKGRGATDALASFADIFPTLVELSGAPLPAGYEVDGRSLAGFLRGETDTHRDWLYSYIGTARMVRDARWVLEAVDPIGGKPEGRFYDYGSTPRVLVDPRAAGAEAGAAYRKLQSVLAGIPYFDRQNATQAAALKRYSEAPFPHKLEDRPEGAGEQQP